jgi:hypothetical protein
MNKKIVISGALIILVLITAFSASSIYLFRKLQAVETKLAGLNALPLKSVNQDKTDDLQENAFVDSCGESCRKTVSEIVAGAIATVSSTTKVIEKTSTSKSAGTAYIPMGTSYTTTSTGWYTIDDTAVYINLENDYGVGAKVSWEALLKVAHANGQAYARLWDDTNKIAVDGSEITTINNSEYRFVSTGVIPFWRGRNLYKVQVKSLNSFEVSITGAKIRISY